MTQKGVEARQLFYEGTKAYKTGDFARPPTKFKEGLAIWQENLKDFPVYRERRPEQEGHRPDRQAVRPRAPAARREGPRQTSRSRTCWPRPRPTPRSTRSTPSRCSASPPTPPEGPPGRRRLRLRRADPIQAFPSSHPDRPRLPSRRRGRNLEGDVLADREELIDRAVSEFEVVLGRGRLRPTVRPGSPAIPGSRRSSRLT